MWELWDRTPSAEPRRWKGKQMQVKRVHKMKVLGVMLDARGSTETAVTHNIRAAERAVAANFDVLFNSL